MQLAKKEIADSRLVGKQIQHKAKRNRWSVALGAVFLLLGIGFGVQKVSGPIEINGDIFLAVYPVSASNGILSAHIHTREVSVAETPELILLGDTSLVAAVPTMAVTPKILGAMLGESSIDSRKTKEVIHYVVQEGDTVQSLADTFEISVDTILWAHDLSSLAKVQVNDELVILPVSGALHLVRPGDTLSEIALWYKADINEILDFNDLESAQGIFVGDMTIIPGGKKPQALPNGRLTRLANSYFIRPVASSYKNTQGVHPFNAIDLSNRSCGGPVYATAGGTAQLVGYNSGYGNYVRILHPNGVVTLYAHLSGSTISTGAKVSQGQTIGYIGHTGRTIPAGPAGCHLHFEVRGATNPFVL